MSDCQPCADDNRRGYCAPGRCYCAHAECHAFASWTPLSAIPEATPVTIKPPTRASSWDDREESTWIDQL